MSSNPAIWKFQNDNAVSLDFYRSDWEVVEDIFSFGYHVGMRFSSSADGALNGQFSNINFDNVDIGLDISSTQGWGIFFSNLNLANAGGGSNRIGIYGRPGQLGTVIVRGLCVWGEMHRPVLWENGGLLQLSDAIFPQWDNKNYPAVTVNSGRSMLRGLYFGDALGTAISIGSNTDRVMVTDCELVGNAIINNGADTLVANNHA